MKAQEITLLMTLCVSLTLLSLTYLHTLQLNPSKQEDHDESKKDTNSYRLENILSQVNKDMESTSEKIRIDCFPFNSQNWINTQRLGNRQDDQLSLQFLEDNVINVASGLSPLRDAAKNLLKQTLCHKNSSFLSMEVSNFQEMFPTNATIDMWSLRLIYFATHIHQHVPAIQEAQARSQIYDTCQPEWSSRQMGPFDFECPTAKFLVVSLGRLGLGAVMRLGVVNALIAGIASNRTVMVVNNSPVGPKFLREPWLLASCPRFDMQCFYMPMTPCVLTIDEISNATTLERGQVRALFRHGRLPDHLTNERVVMMDIALRPQRTPYAFRKNIVKIIEQYILQPLQQEREQNALMTLLTRATSHILQEEQLDNGFYYYFGHNSKHNHALVFYAMRPNPKYSRRLEQIVEKIIPSDMNSDITFGVPIRASDKCNMESECIPFAQYMNMTRHTLMKYQHKIEEANMDGPNLTANVIVTTEDHQVHVEMKKYQEEKHQHRELPFTVRFVSNEYDVRQGTGNPSRTSANMSMDDVMLSAISSLQTQLHARYTLGNCCSNFHLLLFDYLRDGCGAARDQVAECMQDHEDPSFRLCCQWSKTERCLAKRVVSS